MVSFQSIILLEAMIKQDITSIVSLLCGSSLKNETEVTSIVSLLCGKLVKK
jgi:hypothetical protein